LVFHVAANAVYARGGMEDIRRAEPLECLGRGVKIAQIAVVPPNLYDTPKSLRAERLDNGGPGETMRASHEDSVELFHALPLVRPYISARRCVIIKR
jgi:hypothetical protein